MKNLWGKVGTVLFWLLWPVWVVYFKYGGTRSRVLVACKGEVLLVQSWLGPKRYMLPGGGSHKSETVSASAIRELKEETGLEVTESMLMKLGSRRHRQYRLRYHARFFAVELAEKPKLHLQRHEIFRASWFLIETIDEAQLDEEAVYALKRYRPLKQASLL